MKKLFGIFVLCLSLSSSVLYVQADTCPFTASCDGIRLSWSYTGEITGCNVTGPGISGGPQTSSCTGTDVLVPNPNGGLYTFGANDTNSGNSLNTTCQVLPATGCAPTGGTYTISASPNPVQVCTPQTQGPTTISWTAPVGQAVDVYVNGSPTIAGNATGSGSGSAPWIQPGQTYVFTLRKASTPTVAEATVTVTGTTNGCSVAGTGYCGDSIEQTPNASGTNEQCDLGSQNGQSGSTCSATCQNVTPTTTSCGDGIVQSPNSNNVYEQCDHGASNGTTGNSCSSSCQNVTPTTTSCGDGIIQSPNTAGVYEQCDNGASNGTTGNNCTAGCQAVVGTTWCGNGTVESPNTAGVYEQCDHGASNGTTGNSCSSSCVIQVPGTPMVDIGWNGSYAKTKTVALSTGQTTLNDTVYVTSSSFSGNPTCNLEKENGSGGWPTVNSASSNTTTTLAVTGLTQGVHQFRYKCQSTTSSIATITVTAPVVSPINIGWTASPVFDPQDKTVTLSSGQTTTSQTLYVTTAGRTGCALTGIWSGGTVSRIEPVQFSSYAVSVGPGNYIYTLACQDSSKMATLNVNPAGAMCGNGVQESGEQCDLGSQNGQSGSTCSALCQTVALAPGATCNGITIPDRILTNQSFVATPSFNNSGTMPWTTAFYSLSSGLAAWNGSQRFPSSTVNQSGIFSPSYIFTAPGTAGLYALQFRMYTASNVAFGSLCGASGAWVNVVKPQCSDGTDNDDDKLDDYPADPGCSSASDDDETDPSGTVVLQVSANPQLVRQGGSSIVTYEVQNCTTSTGAKGGSENATWELKRDGTSIGVSGSGTSNGPQTYSVDAIQNKTTFTLSCSGTSRSATISVIKISEF